MRCQREKSSREDFARVYRVGEGMHGGNAEQLLGHIKAMETPGHNFKVRAVVCFSPCLTVACFSPVPLS